MSSAINDDELSMSLPAHDHLDRRSHLPSIVSPPSRMEPQLQTPMAQSPGTLRAMNRLNQYTFVKNIGEGSFGKVKLARHKVTGQEVAMKTISRRKLISRDMAGRIEREIQYLQLLRHPHIIKLYTVITTKSDIYMVLEYVPMELFDYIVRHGRLSETKARKLFQQIICAVEYCHRHKIVHRDLKPENLLLDKNMNVKIADFGLSNIMTDGNFLKTSCGSPNYAAPEVIGGKLYAGPEVDVWSCGVILYVFLVGRLPFDDEFIPALFKKIQAGNFHIPSSTPPGAVNLIKRCLQVHPVQRITIAEIRQDDWFVKDLPGYLVDPVEEFLDTGVDPNKAIDPRQLAPGKPPEVVEKIHDTVVGKLGRTMGYAKEDVKDALSKDEPSAIKDAYMIVRENQFMRSTGQYRSENPELESFMASSPPTEPNYPNFGHHHSGHIPMRPRESDPNPPPLKTAREEEIPRISNVKVLNTSLPHVHAELLLARERAKEKKEDPDLVLNPAKMSIGNSVEPGVAIPEVRFDDHENPLVRSKEEQEATSKALKPHSRSVIALNEYRAHKDRAPGMTAISPDEKKPAPVKVKPKKWQFGIRSKTNPVRAMMYVYTALKEIGAVWQVMPALEADVDPNNEEGREDLPPPPPELADGEKHKILNGKYPELGPDYYVAKDHWIIKARILKKGMLMPGEAPTLSAHNSAVSLPAEAQQQLKKHIEELGGYASEDVAKVLGMNTGSKSKSNPGSAQTTRPNSSFGDQQSSQNAFAGPAQPLSRPDSGLGLPSKGPSDQVGVWVFVDIQLYTLDAIAEIFMVDFKCDGYQNVVLHDPSKDKPNSPTNNGSPTASRPTSGIESRNSDDSTEGSVDGEDKNMKPYWKPTTKRYMNKEKEISSPYPYLDVASDLIARLAA